MYKERIIAGLDIGTTSTKVAVGRVDKEGNLDIIGIGTAPSHGVIKGSVANIDKASEAIQNAIKEAEISSGISIKIIRLGISDQYISSEIHKGSITRQALDSEITIEDVKRLQSDMHRTVVPPGNEIVHVYPQTYTVDYKNNVKDPVGMSGVKLEGVFRIMTASSASLRSAQKCLSKIGLHADSITISPLATSLVVLSREEKDAGVCLVDLGGGTVDIAIFHENILRHISVLPLGSDLITSDIKEAFGIMYNQAELLKTKFGCSIADHTSNNDLIEISGIRNRSAKSIPVKTLATVIEARTTEIITFIHNQILASKLQDKLSAGIVLVGGGAELASIADLFEIVTGIETRIGYPNEGVDPHTLHMVKSATFATVTGLVMNGFKSIDYREEYYKSKIKNLKNSADSDIEKKEKVKTGSIFKNLINRTRNLLIDDIE